MNQKGLSQVALLVGSTITVAMLLVAATSLDGITKNTKRISEKNSIMTQASYAMAHILKVGRVANRCLKQPGTVAGTAALECTVDFANSGDAIPFTNVRFETTTDAILTVAYRSGNSGTESWTTQLSYPGISAFELCDSADMTSGSCAIGGNNFTSANSGFFRFQLKTATSLDSKRKFEFASMLVQNSFFVRNGSGSIALYQWGSRE